MSIVFSCTHFLSSAFKPSSYFLFSSNLHAPFYLRDLSLSSVPYLWSRDSNVLQIVYGITPFPSLLQLHWGCAPSSSLCIEKDIMCDVGTEEASAKMMSTEQEHPRLNQEQVSPGQNHLEFQRMTIKFYSSLFFHTAITVYYVSGWWATFHMLVKKAGRSPFLETHVPIVPQSPLC